MYENIVCSIICSQFESMFGRSRQDKKVTVQTHAGRKVVIDTNSDLNSAMQVMFNISPNYETEDGYRHLTLLLFGGGTNYIAVYAKVDWDVTPNETKENEEPQYIKGETPWVCYGYHDSGWRDAVDTVLQEFHGRVSSIDYLFNGATGWYKAVSLTEENIIELKVIRNARYDGRGPWMWQKASDQEFHFEGAADGNR